ncbi:MAG: atoC [Bacteroidetes bacterium]|nr:MAG: atoC [Bacteroidota bacterium]
MLIDDNEIDNFINEKMIEGCAFADTVYVHTGGRSGLEFLQNVARIESAGPELIPGVIFLDINMPMMDGFQFLDEFDKLPEKIKSSTKIVILTTSINPVDLESAEKNKQVVAFMNKPLTREHLDSL